jgi:hypothetical protein
MSSMSVGDATVVLVEFRRGGAESTFFKSRLEMVLEVIDNGAIADSYHGSGEHLAVLDQIEAHIAKVRTFIAEEAAREAADAALDDMDAP